MKQKIIYTIASLLAVTFFLGGCKKDGFKKLSANDSTLTVSTLATGLYDYIAADNSGNIYALRLNLGADTIYKFDASGAKTFFYTAPTTTDHDTTVKHTMACLATDSLGNVYTINYSGGTYIPNVMKITPSGSASIVYSSITAYGGLQIQKIAVDGNGYFYFSDGHGIHTIFTNGNSELVVTGVSTFAVDKKGDIFYPTTNSSGQISINETFTGGASSVIIAGPGSTQTSVTFNNVASLATDEYGDIFTGEVSGTNIATIHLLKYTAYNSQNTGWQSVTTIISSPFGHVDGPAATAKIGVPFSMVTDNNSLYFSEVTGTPADIRKISL